MADTTTATTGIADQYQKHFSKKFLEHAKQALKLVDYGMKATLPKNIGSKIVGWFRPGVASTADVQALTEGTAISTYRRIDGTKVESTLAQYGEVTRLTDILTMTSLWDHMKQTIQTLGEDGALHCDTVIRNVLCHASTGLSKMYAQDQASFLNLIQQTVANSKLVGTDLLRATTQLRTNRAPEATGGGYIAVIPPQIMHDVMKDSGWVAAKQYSDVKDLYKGEVGMWYGVRCVMGTNPFQEDETEGTFASSFSAAGTNTTGYVYTTVVTGRDAYGVPALSGDSPWSPRIIINDKPDKSDPLNQFWVAGWKLFFTAKVLNANFGIALRSRSSFVGI